MRSGSRVGASWCGGRADVGLGRTPLARRTSARPCQTMPTDAKASAGVEATDVTRLTRPQREVRSHPPHRSQTSSATPSAAEGRIGVGVDRLAELLQSDPSHLGHRADCGRDQVRRVGSAPVGHRREERRIGLDQDPVDRRDREGVAHTLRVLERHGAGKGQVGTSGETGTGEVGVAGEAVQHSPVGSAVLVEHGQHSSWASRSWMTSVLS